MLSSVPVAELSLVLLTIPREWTILDSSPLGMGEREASDSGNFSHFSFSGDISLFLCSITVSADVSELSLSWFVSMLSFARSFSRFLTIDSSSLVSDRSQTSLKTSSDLASYCFFHFLQSLLVKITEIFQFVMYFVHFSI